MEINLDDFQANGSKVLVGEVGFKHLMHDIAKVRDKTLYANVMTDPYMNPTVAGLTRQMLEALLEYKPSKLIIQTRSPLVKRDRDLLAQFNTRVNMTIETNSEAIRQEFTPRAPKLESRFEAIQYLAQSGIEVCVTCTPTLPFEKSKSRMVEWVERVKSLDNLTHVVFQDFHDGFLTKTSPEAIEKLMGTDHKWFYPQGIYQIMETCTQHGIKTMWGMPGFAPFPEFK